MRLARTARYHTTTLKTQDVQAMGSEVAERMFWKLTHIDTTPIWIASLEQVL
jgi:hypothetical protein